MKKINVFDELINNTKRMVDHLVEFQLQPRVSLDLQLDTKLATPEGMQIDSLSELTADETGVFAYYGRKVVLFIPDHGYGNSFDQVKNGDLNAGKKVHFTQCKTLDDMANNNRLNRYHINKNQNGLFKIVNNVGDTHTTKLMPCHYCLKLLNYNDYSSIKKQAIFRQNFDFLAFFNGDYQTKFTKLPEYVGQNKGGYAEDWSIISRNFKKSKGYLCQVCGVNLSGYQHLTDVHHIDGVKQNNSQNNLMCLCKLCHANQPNHVHMSISDEIKKQIQQLRWQQRLL